MKEGNLKIRTTYPGHDPPLLDNAEDVLFTTLNGTTSG
jgi:hypothetical protein